MESPLKWIFAKFSPIKTDVNTTRKSSSKDKVVKSPRLRTTPEKKIKKIRLL